MKNVLILGSGTQGLALIKDLKKAGHHVYYLGGKYNYADSSRYLDKKLYCDAPASSSDYFNAVKVFIQQNNIDAVIPMGDLAAEFLSKNKEILQEIVHFKMPDYQDFVCAIDKNRLMALCKEKNYPHPYTINTVSDIKTINKKEIPFPLLIKPNITCGARGMTLVHSYEELLEKLPLVQSKYGDCHLQQYVKQGGAQVEVQLYVDENKHLINSSVIYKYRWYPEKGGSSCCAKSVKNDKIVDILYHLLLDLNWVGFADFDTIEDPDTGELLIMELNPRVPACVKCAIEAGIHWGEIIVNGYLNQPQKEYSYKEEVYLRHLGFETLWFLKSPHRFKTRPCWFKFFGKHIHYQDMSDWTDPLPFFCGTMNNVKKVLLHTEKQKLDR